MFLKISRTNQTVNLDNFDEIFIKTECYNKHHVCARKLDSNYIFIIKTFDTASEAFIFNEVLQHAWINNEKVLIIE